MALNASLSASPIFGYVKATNFQFRSTTVGSPPPNYYIWDMGDGTFYYGVSSVVHSYIGPGLFSVTLSAYDGLGGFDTATQDIKVESYVPDAIRFSQIPPIANPGAYTTHPFTLRLSASQYNPDFPYVDVHLYAQNSRSRPYKEQTKWGFLIPQWRFENENFEVTNTLRVALKPIYFNNTLVGGTGEASFWYIDDTSTGIPDHECPLILFATVETSAFYNPADQHLNHFTASSYSNSRVSRALIWYVNSPIPEYLKISENFVNDIYPLKWEGKPIPYMITVHGGGVEYYTQGLPTSADGILFSYPQSNAIGLSAGHDVQRGIISLDPSSYAFEVNPLTFRYSDEEDFRDGGYAFDSVTVNTTGNNVQLSASAVVSITANNQFNFFPYPYFINTTAWISNPAKHKIHKVYNYFYPAHCEEIFDLIDHSILEENYITTHDVPWVSAQNINVQTNAYELSGFSGIYGIAMIPATNDIWMVDAELDHYYKINSFGDIISSFDLKTSLFGTTGYQISGFSPSYISLDSNLNFWMTFYNSVSVAKFDSNGQLLFLTAPDPTLVNAIESYSGDYYFKPPVVETDRDNNCWVTYNHPLCSALVKYDNNGGLLVTIPLSTHSSPVGLAIDLDNGVWVTNSFSETLSGGCIQKYSTTGTLLSTFWNWIHPGYIVVDRAQNIWFTHNYSHLGHINTQNFSTSSFLLTGNQVQLRPNPDYPIFNQYLYENPLLEGLTCDTFNQIWAINSDTNAVFLLSATGSGTRHRVFRVLPDSNISFVNDNENLTTEIIEGDCGLSLQATGDWTGFKWLQKYTTLPVLSTQSILVSSYEIRGISKPFNVKSFKQNHQIRIQNESFNTTEYYQSLALPEIFHQNSVLFNQYIEYLLGNEGNYFQNDSLGRKIYERIANFVGNTVDITTCHVDKLISLLQEIGLEYNEYHFDYPEDIKRLMNILSVPHHKLWGTKDLSVQFSQSIGPELTVNSLVTAYTNILFKQNNSNIYQLLYVLPLQPGDIMVYPLSALDNSNYYLLDPIFKEYRFWEYQPVYIQNWVENLINWDDPATTLNVELSSWEEWNRDGGIVEEMFNYILTDNLLE